MKNKKYWEKRYAELIETGHSGSMTLVKDESTQAFEDEALKIIPASENKKVLDYGCGSGKKLDMVQKLFQPVKYVGFDEVESIVEYCKKNIKRKGARFVSTIVDKAYDIIFCSTVIQHMEDDEVAEKLDLFYGLLKSSGCLYITALILDGPDTETQIYRDDAGYDKLFADSQFIAKKLGNLLVQGFDVGVWELTK